MAQDEYKMHTSLEYAEQAERELEAARHAKNIIAAVIAGLASFIFFYLLVGGYLR